MLGGRIGHDRKPMRLWTKILLVRRQDSIQSEVFTSSFLFLGRDTPLVTVVDRMNQPKHSVILRRSVQGDPEHTRETLRKDKKQHVGATGRKRSAEWTGGSLWAQVRSSPQGEEEQTEPPQKEHRHKLSCNADLVGCGSETEWEILKVGCGNVTWQSLSCVAGALFSSRSLLTRVVDLANAPLLGWGVVQQWLPCVAGAL